VEIQLSAAADPFIRADLILAAHGDEIGFEEAYLSTLAVPHVTIRAGRLFASFGKHNRLHTHTFPFVTAPLPARELLGAEGLRGDGVSFDVLVPLPFYTELVVQAFSADWEPMGEAEPEDLRYLAHLTTLFDLGAPTTLEIGATFATGRNDIDERTDLIGADLTVKWRPLERSDRELSWTTELVWVDRHDPDTEADGGLWSGVRAQLHRQWWLQGRGALLGLVGEHQDWRAEALVAYVPSEFTTFRLQYGAEQLDDEELVHEVFLQAIVSIGNHPAHAY